jgi:hypothetical protein
MTADRIQYDDDGALDEAVIEGIAHLERMSKKGWFLSMTRPDGSSFCVHFRGKVQMVEHRRADGRGLIEGSEA